MCTYESVRTSMTTAERISHTTKHLACAIEKKNSWRLSRQQYSQTVRDLRPQFHTARDAHHDGIIWRLLSNVQANRMCH